MKLKNTHKIIITVFLTGALFSSCKIKQKALTTDIYVPNAYENATVNLDVDSLKKDSTIVPESWKTFFTDQQLVKLIDSALVKNFDVKIAYQNILQSKAGLALTKGIRLPNLNLNIGAGVRKFGDYTMDGVGNYDTKFSTNLTDKQRLDYNMQDYQLGLGTSWELDIYGKLKNKKEATVFKYLASQEGRNLIQTSVISEIAEAYYNLLIFDRELEIIRENMVLQERAVESVTAQKEFGKTTELAIELVTAQLLAAKSLVIDLERQIIVQENRINTLCGRYPSKIERSKITDNIDIAKMATASIPAAVIQNRPDIRAAEQNLRAENANVKAAKKAFYPSLTLSANVGYNAFRANLLFDSPASMFYNVLGGLTTPLLNRRQLKSDLLQSKASQVAAYINYEKSVIVGFTEVYESLLSGRMYNEIQQVKTEQVELLKRSIETSQALFMNNRASYLEILTAQENYLKAQQELLNVYKFKALNNIQLYKAIGGGWR